MKEEALKWFQEQFDKCFTVEKGSNVYHIYDEDYINLLKIDSILGIETEKYEGDGIVLFKQDHKNVQFLYDHNKICLFLESKFGLNYNEQKDLINIWLKKDDKMCALSARMTFFNKNR